MVQKAINIDIKAGLKSNIMVWNADFRYFKTHYLSYNLSAKMKIQDSTAKKSNPEKFKSKK